MLILILFCYYVYVENSFTRITQEAFPCIDERLRWQGFESAITIPYFMKQVIVIIPQFEGKLQKSASLPTSNVEKLHNTAKMHQTYLVILISLIMFTRYNPI